MSLFSHYENLFFKSTSQVSLIMISYCDCWSDRVVIRADCLVRFEFEVSSFVNLFLNHLETVCVYPELFVHLKVIYKVPFNNYIFTCHVKLDWHFIKSNLELDKLLEIIQTNSCWCSHFLSNVVLLRILLFPHEYILSGVTVLSGLAHFHDNIAISVRSLLSLSGILWAEFKCSVLSLIMFSWNFSVTQVVSQIEGKCLWNTSLRITILKYCCSLIIICFIKIWRRECIFLLLLLILSFSWCLQLSNFLLH